MEAIAVAIITGTFSVIGSAFAVSRQSKKDEIDAVRREQRQNDRLEVLEKKIDEHNNYGKKFASCEQSLLLMQKDHEIFKADISSIKADIKELRR